MADRPAPAAEPRPSAAERRGYLNIVDNIAQIHIERGETDRAKRMTRDALALVDTDGDDDNRMHLLTRFAEACRDDPDAAVAAARRAVELAEISGNALGMTESHLALARALRWRGESTAAAEHAETAHSLAERHGYAVLRGKALTVLAKVRVEAGDGTAARAYAAEAVALHRGTGHRLGEARGLVVLAATEPESAAGHRKRARELFAACGSSETGEDRDEPVS